MEKGILKFNGGVGALLCGHCRHIVVTGLPKYSFYVCRNCDRYVENPHFKENNA
jgi:hypothetical protein